MTRDRSHRRGARPLASERLHSLILALACGGCAAHGTSVGVQSADLPVSQGPVAEGVVAAPIATTPDPHGSRIVPQVGFDPTSYQLTDPSGRFAVFDRVIVDLRSDRVAWLHEGGIIPVQTPENHLLRQHLEDTVGVELWDLLDGTTRLFPGTLVLHAPMAGRVALQRGPALDIIDVVQRQRVALLPALGEVLSVVPSADGWRILARTGTRREQPALVLLSTPPAPADGVKTLALELPSSRFSLAARSERSSDPFLVIGERGQLSVNVIESCAACPAPGQLSSWSSALDQRTGRGGPWSEKRFAAAQPPGGALPLEGPHVRAGSAPMPASVQDHLGGLRTTPELGVFLDVSPDSRHLLTGTSSRVCVWSLERAERFWCEPREHITYQFLDSTRVWMLGEHAGNTEIAIWDLAQRRSLKRSFAPGSVTVPGSGEQFLVYSFDEASRTYGVEASTLTGQAPLWAHAGCGAAPYFTSHGTRVVCANPDGNGALLLDATNGKGVDTVVGSASISSESLEPDHPARPCELVFTQGAGAEMTQHGHLVATLFDLTPTEWALVLPEGELISSADAASYLAFYDATGTPASRAQVERRRDPKAVQAALDRLRQALAGCTD